MSKKSKKLNDQDTPVVNFDYIKSNYFRVIHADGAVGGLTPSGNLQMNFWSQRYPIPRQVVYSLPKDEGGEIRPGEEIERDQREGIVREVEAGVVLDLFAAIELRDWLSRQIQAMQERISEFNQDEQEQS